MRSRRAISVDATFSSQVSAVAKKPPNCSTPASNLSIRNSPYVRRRESAVLPGRAGHGSDRPGIFLAGDGPICLTADFRRLSTKGGKCGGCLQGSVAVSLRPGTRTRPANGTSSESGELPPIRPDGDGPGPNNGIMMEVETGGGQQLCRGVKPRGAEP